MDPDDFQARLDAFVGASAGEPSRARDPVNPAMIRHWCDAVGDRNPVYTDPDFAAASVHGGIVAPPTMLQAWTMPGLRPPEQAPKPGLHAALFGLLDEAGFTSVVATDCSQEYRRYLRPGDELSVAMEVESIAKQKQTALGVGHFVTQRLVYRDQAGEVVAEMRFRMLKFRPGTGRAAPQPAAAKPSVPRPRPGITHDNRFYWEGLAKGRLLLQRCSGCLELRHPPGPMCPACRSLAWEAVPASGAGKLYSFVVMHHPPVPPFEYPNPIGLVELAEGPRLVANLALPREELAIGTALRCRVTEVEPGFFLPVFHRAEEGA